MALILTRFTGQRVIIGQHDALEVVGTSRNGARIRIINNKGHAPRLWRATLRESTAIADCAVTLIDVQRNRATLQFKAPKHIQIDREEIRIRKECAA